MYLCAQNANRMFGNFGELLDLHASHKIYGDASEEEEQEEEEEEVSRCAWVACATPWAWQVGIAGNV